ncbi:MAG: ABC-F family ATP-binding cassette domain-containing protein [Rikenellaceae bacterium]|nr:ABC-F family ATP-binding cassette domain-containing protein [Rikenellaceae bacterium]
MASILQIENLTKSFGERVLFEDITLHIDEGEKVALVAANGIGKSTLLRIVAGREDYQAGKITFRRDLRVAILDQNPLFKAGRTVLEACLDAHTEASEAVRGYERALATGEGLEAAMAAMDAAAAWDFEQQAKEVLTQLSLTDFTQPVEQLSGGQAKRLALAQVLVAKADLMILDEPTNHLDLKMIEWLEDHLAAARCTLLMVTHDRYFLDRIATRIVELDDKRLYAYRGNYGDYLEKRQERIDLINAAAEKTRNLYRRELEWIRRTPSARTGKAKYRIDAFEQLSEERRTQLKEQQVEIGIESSRLGTKVFEMHNLTKRYEKKCLLNDFSYTFTKGEKLGIVGDNGIGKSTFVKMLLGEVAPDSGRIEVGQTIRFGYYAQQGLQFKEEDRVIDVVKRISEEITLADGGRVSASQLLTRFLFSPAAQYDFVAKLSGGERRRLYLCTVLIANPNFLILDEPTNDLDIQTLNVLEEYLRTFGGCVIVISHDRYFMDRIADHLFVMEGEGRIKDFPGNYTQYRLWRKEQEEAEAEARAERERAAQKQTNTTPAKPQRSYADRLSFKERRELEALEEELPQLEERKKGLEEQLSSGALAVDALTKISTEITALIEEIEEKTLRWMELSEKN